MFYVIASRAKSAFENLKKNYTKKRSNLRNSKKSGTSREAVAQAESELRQWSFLTWLDALVQPRASRSSFHLDYSQQSQQSQQPIEENNNFSDNEEEDNFMEDYENDEFHNPEGNFQMSQVITKDAASERQERVNVQAKMKQPIAKKKLAPVKESEMEQQNLTFLKSVNERMESRDKRKKVDDGEDRFLATIADELIQLTHRERLLAKNEIKNTLFLYQLQILDKQNAIQVTSTINMPTVETILFLSYGINCPYHSIPHMEIPSQFISHTTKTIIIFEVQKTHIVLLQLNHLFTLQYLMETKQIFNIYRI